MTEAKKSMCLSVLLQILTVHFVTCMVNSGTRHNIDEFKFCLSQQRHSSLRECVGRTAISFLQRFDERENVTLVSDLVISRDDKLAARSLVNILDSDPVDFRGILENAGAVFSQRSLQWHMDRIYPGLMLQIGPTANTNSLVEFVLDPRNNEREFGFEEVSTARILAKNYLVPFLLGIKFNLVALVPLLFAGICLLLKKSLFFAKLAIYVSGLLGVGGVAGALGSLGGLGGFGFGGLGGGSFLGAPPLHGHSLDGVGGSGGGLGAGSGGAYFPGKTSVFNHYDADELHHNSPYKRTDRKVNFEKAEEYPSRGVVAAVTEPIVPDRFYEYERQVLLQDRNSGSKLRTHNGKLGPSAFEDNSATGGWQAVDVRSH